MKEADFFGAYELRHFTQLYKVEGIIRNGLRGSRLHERIPEEALRRAIFSPSSEQLRYVEVTRHDAPHLYRDGLNTPENNKALGYALKDSPSHAQFYMGIASSNNEADNQPICIVFGRPNRQRDGHIGISAGDSLLNSDGLSDGLRELGLEKYAPLKTVSPQNVEAIHELCGKNYTFMEAQIAGDIPPPVIGVYVLTSSTKDPAKAAKQDALKNFLEERAIPYYESSGTEFYRRHYSLGDWGHGYTAPADFYDRSLNTLCASALRENNLAADSPDSTITTAMQTCPQTVAAKIAAIDNFGSLFGLKNAAKKIDTDQGKALVENISVRLEALAQESFFNQKQDDEKALHSAEFLVDTLKKIDVVYSSKFDSLDALQKHREMLSANKHDVPDAWLAVRRNSLTKDIFSKQQYDTLDLNHAHNSLKTVQKTVSIALSGEQIEASLQKIEAARYLVGHVEKEIDRIIPEKYAAIEHAVGHQYLERYSIQDATALLEHKAVFLIEKQRVEEWTAKKQQELTRCTEHVDNANTALLGNFAKMYKNPTNARDVFMDHAQSKGETQALQLLKEKPETFGQRTGNPLTWATAQRGAPHQAADTARSLFAYRSEQKEIATALEDKTFENYSLHSNIAILDTTLKARGYSRDILQRATQEATWNTNPLSLDAAEAFVQSIPPKPSIALTLQQTDNTQAIPADLLSIQQAAAKLSNSR
jgi:hypothetical protein